MAFFTRSRLFGILLLAASLPLDPGVARALAASGSATSAGDQPRQSDAIEGRLRRIAAAIREHDDAEVAGNGASADGRLARVFLNGPRVGWGNGGFRNGGFYNGGFRNGGFFNGGFRNGGFRNGGFRNGGWRNYW
ncbi:GrrA/OscA1 family cyclophane-containing rSAM-modified RiPP [Synechococcus sp. CS-205]|uniref:GrrA/OscA1 family cyclophane-containing rSAM-modified RiPP n=1 Tax=Synechococcus sp. CS-205 TaxID=2847984 RepID=UPI00223B318D|nr:GrrA/OscA1 family cyclophane-containing rSAM-modified RiPP [Synechococcus sp. CS-205]MCT0248007.1 rSAM-associated Gly-rich repeat protein [Synechococcus sp. CS-205]